MKSSTSALVVGLLAVAASLGGTALGVPRAIADILGLEAGAPGRTPKHADRQQEDIRGIREDIETLREQLDAVSTRSAAQQETITTSDVRRLAREVAGEVLKTRETAAKTTARDRPIPQKIRFKGGESDLDRYVETVIERREQRLVEEKRQKKIAKSREKLVLKRAAARAFADQVSDLWATDMGLDAGQASVVKSALSTFVDTVGNIQMQRIDGTLDKQGAKDAAAQAHAEMMQYVGTSLNEEQLAEFGRRTRRASGKMGFKIK